MRARNLVFLFASTVLPVALMATSVLGGCGAAVTLSDATPTDGGAGNGDALAEAEPSLIDSGADVVEQSSSDMEVDGIPCTGVTADVTRMTAPDGNTWTLDLKGTCGALGVVDVYVGSKDNLGYPQTCGPTGSIVQMSVGSEGDAGTLAYSTDYAGSACNITDGPSVAVQTTAPRLTATVASATGKTHVLRYGAASAATLGVDGKLCTVTSQTVTTATAPDGKTWTLDLHGSCPSLMTNVDIFVVSKDDLAYPQSCGSSTNIQMSVSGEGDAGFLAYEAASPGGSCVITSGPSAMNLATGIKVTATVANASGSKKHDFAYAAANAP